MSNEKGNSQLASRKKDQGESFLRKTGGKTQEEEKQGGKPKVNTEGRKMHAEIWDKPKQFPS